MYSREELDPSFGPYEVNICDEIIILKDGTKISSKFWFPGPKKPFVGNVTWSNYCQAIEENNFDGNFPTVMEYLPYCKSTWTRERDHLRYVKM